MHHLILILIDLILFNAFILYPIEAKSKSLSFDLIHRDSKLSPFYNHSMTEVERSLKAVTRSLHRLHHFNSSVFIDAKTVESDLTAGDYFMKIAISEPDTTWLTIPDMVGDLIWLQCGPCTDCANEHPSFYNPKSSETYRVILFGSEICNDLEDTTEGESNVCRYQYSDIGSSVVLGTESFYFKLHDNNDRKFSNIVFGCDDEHQDDFIEGVDGVVGLGQGKLSLVSQLGTEVGKKFSYCLLENSESSASKIIFGSDVRLYNHDIEYKAQLTHNPPDPQYYLNLESISVNNQLIKVLRTIDRPMVVDIQTSLTTLPINIYSNMIAKFKAEASGIPSVEHSEFGTCFSKHKIQELENLPNIVFHFSKADDSLASADFHVNPVTLLQNQGELMCMTITPNDGLSVLGNMAQVNRQMLFDPSSHSLTFAPLNCNDFST